MNEELIAYYGKYNEDKRLTTPYGRVEYLTTLRYIDRFSAGRTNLAVLEAGAATGRYSLELARRGFRVNLIGGEIRGVTEAIVGNAACEEMRAFNFTKCFMGTNGVNSENGFTTPDINEALIKGRAIAQSRERYVLCTAEKFHIISPVRFAAFTDAVIITDQYPNDWYARQENIICVQPEETVS